MLADFRWRVYTKAQHPYNHAAADVAFTHPAFPGVSNANDFFNWLAAVLYPQDKAAVADMTALNALVGNTLGDYRVVSDTGSGQAGGFRWEQREADATPKWYQIYAMNWGADSILEQFYNQTQDVYVNKHGFDDLNADGTVVSTALKGQTIYGGRSAGTNLTLYPNAGDAGAAVTGEVQTAGRFLPLADGTLDLGKVGGKFRTAYLATSLLVGTMTLSGGTIADSSGALSLGALNVTTTGFSKAGVFQAGDGAAGAPAFTLTSDTTTGWYRQAAGVFSFASAGVEAARVSLTQVAAGAGVVGAPALSFVADLATGAYQPAGSQWALATAGVQRQLVDASGNVTFGAKFYLDQANSRLGVGTLSPSVDLHAFKASSPQMRLDSQNSSGSAPGEFQFFAARAANANLAALDDLGYLDWYGRVSGASMWLAGIQGRYRGDGTTSFGDLIFATANNGAPAERMRLRYDGKLGVGVSDPLYPLHVSGGAVNDNLKLLGNTISALDVGGGITLTPNGTGRVVAGVGLDPSSDGVGTLGRAAVRWDTLYLKTGLSDGTNSVAPTVLTSLRSANTAVGAGMSLFWDAGTSTWLPSLPDAEIDHRTISFLTTGDSGHTQFALLAGRAGGQTLSGGTAASEILALQSTAHATKGFVTTDSIIKPTGTTGLIDLGASAASFKDFYMVGQAIGLRVENYATAGVPAAAAGTKGRLYFDTTLSELFVDKGGTWTRVGLDRYYNQDSSGWTGSVNNITYTILGWANDVRQGLWQFQDNAGNHQVMQGAAITFPSTTTVNVAFDNNLSAGTYTLVGIG